MERFKKNGNNHPTLELFPGKELAIAQDTSKCLVTSEKTSLGHRPTSRIYIKDQACPATVIAQESNVIDHSHPPVSVYQSSVRTRLAVRPRDCLGTV